MRNSFPIVGAVLATSLGALSPPSVAIEQTTALAITPFHEGRLVHGDDGKDHVEYDLLVANAFVAPVKLKFIAVVDDRGAELMRLQGDALAAATQSLLDQKPIAEIPASGAAAVEIDLIVGTKEVAGPEVTIDARPPIVVLPPLSGSGWGAFNGCCVPNLHRSVRVAAATRIATPEAFAIDWVQVDGGGRFFSGNGKANGDYPSYGAPVRSVAAGDVVALHDGMADSPPSSALP